MIFDHHLGGKKGIVQLVVSIYNPIPMTFLLKIVKAQRNVEWT